jgi:hypothetical protein
MTMTIYDHTNLDAMRRYRDAHSRLVGRMRRSGGVVRVVARNDVNRCAAVRPECRRAWT